MAADCLHLQLYRDSKDRYKQGQTKASLSLQHFLGVYSGFTLDKESNTIAIICQDVTVVLAFDTRERLIQWQVKIANNLGEDEQFLVQVCSSPARAKVSPGPARLHLRDHRFCLTTGVPPRLAGHWQIRQLRKYGPVDNKFCFEGGSGCGKGEGLFILVTDQAENITRAFKMAAEGRLAVRRRPLARNMSMMTSPRRSIHSRTDPRVSDLSCLTEASCDYAVSQSAASEYAAAVSNYSSAVSGCGWSHDDLLHSGPGPGPALTCSEQTTDSWRGGAQLERCVSCISKLGVTLSRSSTLTSTPTWAGESYDRRRVTCGSVSLASNYDRTTTSSLDYWSCGSSPPERLRSCTVSGRSSLPSPSPSSSPADAAYGNYDVPRPTARKVCCTAATTKTAQLVGSGCSQNYDTPRNMRDSLPPATRSCCSKRPQASSVVVEKEDPRGLMCPCQRVMCWAGSWIRLPYLLSGAFRSPANTIHKVKLDGEGKMPFVNCRGENYTCEPSSNNYQIRTTLEEEREDELDVEASPCLKERNTHYANVKVILENNAKPLEKVVEHEPKPLLSYVNLEFAKSLEYYENSRELMQRTDNCKISNQKEMDEDKTEVGKDNGCKKCGHSLSRPPPKPSPKNGDYLLMEPAVNHSLQRLKNLPSSPPQSPAHERASQGYLPMQPISGKPEELQRLRIKQLNEKSQSVPSLRSPRHKSLPSPSVHGSLVYHCISETNSPYSRRRLMTAITSDIRKEFLLPSIRKRSSSMDSSRCLENLESIEEKVVSPTKTLVNTPTISNATSIDSLSDLSMNQRPIPTSSSEHGLSRVDHSEYVPYQSTLFLLNDEPAENEDTVSHVPCNPTMQIKRSASIPCRSVYNRDSSSSNDSGVSTGSLPFRRRDLMDLDFHAVTKKSDQEELKKVKENIRSEVRILRKSKSVDPFEEVNFEFDEFKPPVKCSSAGATVSVGAIKRESKGYLSPVGVPYIDSHSTSSGTSDMSDYIETLSLSSYTSSDTPDSFQLGHSGAAVNTLRPRFGKEYQTFDRINQKSTSPQTSVAVDSLQRCESAESTKMNQSS